MGADERRAFIRKVSEAIELIDEAPNLDQKIVIAQFVVLRLGDTLKDVQASAENLESINNFDQAASLREEWSWVETLSRDMLEAVRAPNDDYFNTMLEQVKTSYKENLPAIKRRMLKLEDITGVKLEEVSIVAPGEHPKETTFQIVDVEDEFVDAIPRIDNPTRVILPKNVTVVVRCKSLDKHASKPFIGIKQLVMRGTVGTIIGRDTDRGVVLVDLHLDQDLWPDADRLNNHVVIPMKELRTPVRG